jgi:hypothetical protein
MHSLRCRAPTLLTVSALVKARWQAADDAGSEQHLARAAAVLEPLEATEAEHLAKVLEELAGKERQRKDFAAALQHGERAVAITERRVGATSPALADAAWALAKTHRAQGNEVAVGALFQRLRLVERVLPPGATISSSPSAAPASAQRRCEPPGQVQQGTLSNATQVVDGLAAGFRGCYNRALAQDPSMKGSLRLTAKIGANGEVLLVRTLTPASYLEAMVTCPMERLLAAKFAPPEGGRATVVVPVTFVTR